MTFQAIYQNDLKQYTRNRWVVWFSVLFTLVAVSFLLFGGADQETYDGFNTNIASLLNVNLFLLPLVLFVMGAVSFSSEKEEGLLSLVLSYPISYMHLIVAKILSLITAMMLILCFSYGFASIAGFLFGTELALNTFMTFFFLSILLVFLLAPLSILLGMYAKTKFQAMTLALGGWAFLVLLYEFLFMGLITIVPPLSLTLFLTVAVAANPVELIRVAAIIIIDRGVSLGPSLYEFTTFITEGFGVLVLVIFMFLWVIVPVVLCYLGLRGGKVNAE